MRTTTKQGRGAPEHEQLAARKVARPQMPLATGTLPTARSERVNVRVEEIDGIDDVAIGIAPANQETIR